MDQWRGRLSDAGARVRTSAAPAAQAAAVAGAAWWVAATFLHVPQNFFAPFVAIVVLLGARGGRGPRALGVILGAVLGVGFGELSLLVFGPNAPWLFVMVAVSILVTASLTSDTLTMLQAGIGTCLVGIMSSPVSGYGRAGSAVIGGVVALVGTQLLFTPAPGRLAGPAVSAVLRAAARLLERPADAARFAPLVSALAALDETRAGLHRIRRFTARGRVQRTLVDDMVRTTEAAHRLGLDALAAARDGTDTNHVVERLRSVAGPPSRAGRPGRVVPQAGELDDIAAGIAPDGRPRVRCAPAGYARPVSDAYPARGEDDDGVHRTEAGPDALVDPAGHRTVCGRRVVELYNDGRDVTCDACTG